MKMNAMGMLKKFTVVAVLVTLTGCTYDAYRVQTNRTTISKAEDGTRWVLIKVASEQGGDKGPAQACDETLLVRIDAKNYVHEAQAINPKTCVGEGSLRNVLVGTVLPAALAAGGQIGAAELLRPATTRVNESVTNGNSNSNDSNANSNANANSNSKANAVARQAQGQGQAANAQQTQAQGQGQQQNQKQDQAQGQGLQNVYPKQSAW